MFCFLINISEIKYLQKETDKWTHFWMKSRNVTFIGNYSYVAYKSSSKGRVFMSESTQLIRALCKIPSTVHAALHGSQFSIGCFYPDA